MRQINTGFCIAVKCKCGSIVAAAMIIGGFKINKGFTTTMAKILNSGGEVFVVDTKEEDVSIGVCLCGLQKDTP